MDETRSGRPVLVGISNPEAVQQLVRTAGDLARLGAGTVRLVTVATKPRDSPFGVFTDETIVREFAADSHALIEGVATPAGVTVERDVVAARSAAKGLLAAVEEANPAALVVGWQGRTRRSDAVFGTTVDTLVERAPCDLYVERVGREANGVDSVLLPVAGGPHVQTAAKAAAAIGFANDASVTVLSVRTPEQDASEATAFATEGREAVLALSGSLDVTTETIDSSAIARTIADAAADHDIVVLAATRKGALRRRVVGSVPKRVVEGTDQTVVLSRSGAVARGPLDRLGGLLRR